MSNEQTIRRFYDAFARRDPATMRECYTEDAEFDDPAFSLRGRREVAGMWQMLLGREQQEADRAAWKFEYGQVRVAGDRGWAHWEPHYRFGATGRVVHNIIDAEFQFRDGLICKHHDSFDFWRWSRQALGPAGWLLGWSPMLKAKVRKTARAGLDAFLAKAG